MIFILIFLFFLLSLMTSILFSKVVGAVWGEREPHTADTLKSLHNLHDLFASLKAAGIKIAVCTADSRKPTEEALQKLGEGFFLDDDVVFDPNSLIL